MDWVQDNGNKEGSMKEEITTEEPIIQDGLVELIYITHILIQP